MQMIEGIEFFSSREKGVLIFFSFNDNVCHTMTLSPCFIIIYQYMDATVSG